MLPTFISNALKKFGDTAATFFACEPLAYPFKKAATAFSPTHKAVAQLREALLSGDIKKAEDVFKEMSVNPNTPDPKTGETLLFDIARYGTKEAVEFLLKKGASVKVTNLENETPVMAACRNETAFAPIIDLIVSYAGPGCLYHKGANKHDILMNAISGSCLEAAAHLMNKYDMVPDFKNPMVETGLRVSTYYGTGAFNDAIGRIQGELEQMDATVQGLCKKLTRPSGKM